MELRHFRYFVAVAENSGFTRAAAQLNVSQPTLSQQIRALEKELGVVLVDREPHGIKLTVAGEAFYEHAQRVLAAVRDAVTDVRRAAQGVSILRVGLANPLPLSVHLPIISAFRAAVPGVRVECRELAFPTYDQPLLDGEVDVALIRQPVDERRLVCRSVVSGEPTGLLTPITHQFSDADAVDLADFLEQSLPSIATEVPWAARSHWLLYPERNGAAPRFVGDAAATTAEMMLSSGLNGVVCPAPLECVRGLAVPRFKTVLLRGGPLTRTCAARRIEDTRPLPVMFCDLAADLGAELVSAGHWDDL